MFSPLTHQGIINIDNLPSKMRSLRHIQDLYWYISLILHAFSLFDHLRVGKRHSPLKSLNDHLIHCRLDRSNLEPDHIHRVHCLWSLITIMLLVMIEQIQELFQIIQLFLHTDRDDLKIQHIIIKFAHFQVQYLKLHDKSYLLFH